MAASEVAFDLKIDLRNLNYTCGYVNIVSKCHILPDFCRFDLLPLLRQIARQLISGSTADKNMVNDRQVNNKSCVTFPILIFQYASSSNIDECQSVRQGRIGTSTLHPDRVVSATQALIVKHDRGFSS